MDASDLKPGDRIGEYVLEERIGRGGFGDVWRARHHLWRDRVVAVKVAADADRARVLRQEGVLQEIVQHENAVAILGADADHDPPYLVMEYVDGESLRARLEREGRLEPADALRVARDVLAGLAAAHEKGIVHRDLKPENVLIGRDGRAKLTDFGLGRLHEEERQRLALSGGLASEATRRLEGTIAYMAPEQREPGRPIDARADVYAFGILLFEMLTGRRPEGIESPGDVLPGLDRRIDEVFARCYCRLEKRYANARAVLAAIEEVAGRRAFSWAALEPLEGARGPRGALPAWIGVPAGPITIGDAQDAHLWIVGGGISRRHAVIEHRGGAFWISAPNPSADVHLIPARILAGARPEDHAVKVGTQPQRLGEGVVIGLGPRAGAGGTRFRFHDGPPAPEPTFAADRPHEVEPTGRMLALAASILLGGLAIITAAQGQIIVMALLGAAAIAAFHAAGVSWGPGIPTEAGERAPARPTPAIPPAPRDELDHDDDDDDRDLPGTRPAGIFLRTIAFAIDIAVITLFIRWRPAHHALVVWFAYDWLATAIFGATVGKWLLGMRVVRDDGAPLGLIPAVVRTIAKFLSTLPMFFGFLLAGFSHSRRALHDYLADSRVVRVDRF